MTKLTLTNYVQGNATLLENEFIDKYMPAANGEYVKVYLLLLRYKGDPSKELNISTMADALECTEKDVVRALNYWKKQGLLDYEAKVGDVEPVPAPSNVSAPASVVKAAATKKRVLRPSQHNREEFREVLHVTEQYLGKTLSKTESETIIYFYDELGMSADLIEYLIEYCVENGHKSIHYIRTVALSWMEQGFQTVQDAKSFSGQYTRNSFAVLNAYGIKGRAPATAEIAFIRRWSNDYGFTTELITEACNRTINAIHQPSFDYTEKILKSWLEKNVHSLKDLKALDLAYLKEKDAKKGSEKVPAKPARSSRNRFNNFEGRTYSNMDELERKLIEM